MLKGNVFVGDFGAGRLAAASTVAFLCGSSLLQVVGTARCAPAHSASSGSSAVGTAAKHAEVVGHNFKAGTLLAFLVLPFAGLDAALDEHQRTLLQILLRDFGLLAPDD